MRNCRCTRSTTVPEAPLCAPDLYLVVFEFVHNVHVSGMVHGRVVRPPEIGATVTNVDEKSQESERKGSIQKRPCGKLIGPRQFL
jgi:hypothetical protein